MVRIIYSCKDYAVSVKPHGVLSEWSESSPNMIAELAETLGIDHTNIYPVHRLDRTTEGIMVYALSKKAAAILSQCIADGRFHKTYLALITAADDLPKSGEMQDMLFFDRRQAKSFVVTDKKQGAKKAVLTYELGNAFEWHGESITPAKVKLLTGRTHQIRAQFAARRSPLIGDGKYGSRVNYKRPALISTEISFEWKNEQLSYSLGDPTEYFPKENV